MSQLCKGNCRGGCVSAEQRDRVPRQPAENPDVEMFPSPLDILLHNCLQLALL